MRLRASAHSQMSLTCPLAIIRRKSDGLCRLRLVAVHLGVVSHPDDAGEDARSDADSAGGNGFCAALNTRLSGKHLYLRSVKLMRLGRASAQGGELNAPMELSLVLVWWSVETGV